MKSSSLLITVCVPIVKQVMCLPVRPTLSTSLSLIEGWAISIGFAGGFTRPEVIQGWKQKIDAPTKNTSSLHLLAKTGYLWTCVCPSLSKNSLKTCWISYKLYDLSVAGLPINPYSSHGASPQVSLSTCE